MSGFRFPSDPTGPGQYLVGPYMWKVIFSLLPSQLCCRHIVMSLPVKMGIAALVFISINTMSWSASLSGGAVVTLLMSEGFVVKNRSRVFAFRVESSTTCVSEWSLLQVMSELVILAFGFPGRICWSDKFTLGRLKSPPSHIFPLPLASTWSMALHRSSMYASSDHWGL